MQHKSSKGFALIILLMLTPVLATLLALVFRTVMILEFKSEFRFKCINESLVIQRQLLETRTSGRLPATKLLIRLQKINTPIKYYVTLSEYPEEYEDGIEALILDEGFYYRDDVHREIVKKAILDSKNLL